MSDTQWVVDKFLEDLNRIDIRDTNPPMHVINDRLALVEIGTAIRTRTGASAGHASAVSAACACEAAAIASTDRANTAASPSPPVENT
jgi:hypothetical protein